MTSALIDTINVQYAKTSEEGIEHRYINFVDFRHDSTMLKQALHCAHCSVSFM